MRPDATWTGALLALLLWALPGAAAARVADSPAPGVTDLVALGAPPKEVGRLRVLCDLPGCADPGFSARLAALTCIDPDKPVAEAALRRAELNVMATGWFSRVEAEEIDGVIVVRAMSAVLIRDVRVRAGASLGSELRRRIFLRAGEQWTGDARLIARQQRDIVESFERAGRFGASVDIDVEPSGEGLVDLDFRIDRGARKTVDRVYVRGADVFGYEKVRDQLLSHFNLMRHFTADRFERAQRAVLRSYRRAGYLQARVARDEFRIDPTTGTVDLFVELREGPRWELNVYGATLFPAAELFEAMTFTSTGFIDEAEIEVAESEIRRLYETVGRAFAQVRSEWTVADDGTQNLSFWVNEGAPSEIRSITLAGATSVPQDVLREGLGTVEYDILSVGGYLQRSQLASDVQVLEALYQAHGFLAARVQRVVLIGEDGGRDLHVVFDIEEGPMTRVSGVIVEGLPAGVRPPAALSARAGTPFVPDRISEDQTALLAALHAEGYAFATITAACAVDGSADPVPCVPPALAPERQLSLTADEEVACDRSVRSGAIVEECVLARPIALASSTPGIRGSEAQITYAVDPGRRVVFGALFVQGNFATRGRVIEREMMFEAGDAYDVQRLLDGQARLRSLDLFDSVRASPVGATSDPATGDIAHVVVQVEEASSRFFDHRIGMEAQQTSSQGFLLILSNEPTFRELNLAGRAREVRAFGNLDVDAVNPRRVADQELRGRAGVLYLARRFYLRPRAHNAVELQTQVAYDYDLLASAPAPLTKELAFDARVRDQSEQVDGLYVEGAFALRRAESRDQSDPTIAAERFDRALILSLSPRVTYDRRDNALNPTRGAILGADLELADDFLGILNSERYTKLTLRASGFVPLGGGLTLGINARVGMAAGGVSSGFRSSEALSLPVSERFSLGGVTTLRGFAEGGVTSRSTDEFGGDHVVNGNLELRYPFLRSLDVQGAVFVDAGQLAANLDDLRPDAFRLTAGFGVRWLIADLLPVLIDYGAVLNRRSGEGLGRLHVNVGYTF